ncbi:NADPH--cytochrome P450 reductase isoform X1 [Danaus plexippus]|uniref:NADPH--cytochrome P450 reductase n=1 Tax=Danaus plexippus plexippus TaxID=278856 RepID=A0A212EIJ2_DANPL|nr:NADPH--cytochrome P450 reductase isoform X1 [Danaus plexippus]OWR41297.1 NADPH cytochrome P450 reductase [Danaus plexippus plexippus]
MSDNTQDILKEAAAAAAVGGSLFSTFDIIMLIFLFGAALWWLYSSRKENKKDDLLLSKYSIQPAGSIQITENSFIKKLQSSGRSLVVFYGSQTGTGEEFAGRLAKEGIRYKMKGMVADPEECDMEELTKLRDIENSLAVFCLATYGEGDPTDNAMDFYEWLKSGDPDLTGLNYAVFGLGNKTYEHFNSVAIYVDKRLEELGATRVFELGLGDDDANIEDDFITWKEKFWPAVCEKYNIENTGEEELTRQFRLVTHAPDEITPNEVFTGEIARLHSFQNQRVPFDAKNPFLAQIIVNKELHKGGDRSCLHIELDISNSKMRYEAGDHVAVYPINDRGLVERLGVLTGADLDEVFSLINTDQESTKKNPFPCPTSYRTALSHYIEITALPRTHILRELAEYCMEDEDKNKLLLMATNSQEGKALYQSFIVDSCRNIVHILEDLKSCKPPLDHLCELLPRLQPRYYSISSSPKLYPETVHVTAVVVKYETPTGRLNKGVTTTWLAENKPEPGKPFPRVPIYIRKSQFRLPLQTQTPVLMVGPGTGLAPFRGFLQERSHARINGKEVGDTILYFGCRHRDQDYIYQEELEEFERNGDVTLHVAFSRDQPKKVYVTHLLENNLEQIWDVIGNRNGHFYICGDAKNMAVDVRNIVIKAVQEKGGRSEAEAVQFLKKLESMKKYSADVWS